MTNEHEKWRKLLQPLITGLVALVAAATLYLQRSDNDKTDSRLTALEIRADVTDKRSDKFGADIDNVRNLDSVDAESGIARYKHMACNMAFICEMMGDASRRGK